jgi:mRNA-degrading endonuclease RelE of RelBE toxin-antitoxin system
VYRLKFTDKAVESLSRISSEDVKKIKKKILWLVQNGDKIQHQRIKGSQLFSLHSGKYRIPYLVDKQSQVIIIDDVGKHDEVYDKINKL